MRRREFTTLLGGAVTWPLVAHAQQPAMQVVGFLHSASPDPYAHMVAAFRQGLKDTGYVEGRNVTIEFRWAEGDNDRLPAMAAELVRRQVAVIVANTPSALAARAATSTIPIVFNVGGDPVRLGLVASFNRPGGNATGLSFLTAALEAKRLGLLHELVPQASVIAVFVNTPFPDSANQLRDLQDAARVLGQQIHALNARTESEIDTGFATLAQQRPDALVVASDPFFTAQRNQIVKLAARHSVPTMYYVREFPAAGGLISYGPSLADAFRQAGIYTGRILKGEKPSNLPVMQPTKFELVINLKTAKTLGLTIPPGVLAIADEVIE
jgi:putative ABC transport system substrate-binding protein